MSNPIVDFKKAIEAMKTSLKKIKKKVNSDEIEEIKRLVNKYDVILKNDVEEKELILKYKTFYDKLNENVLNKRKEINDIDEKITTLSEFSLDDNFTTIVNKKKDNVNQIIDCINRIVERIKELETTIYNNRIKELNNMKVERYGNVKQPTKQVQIQIQQPIKTNDNEMNIINNSMNVLKQWSNKNTFNIIFDSDIDGDGSNNVLHNKVLNKSNLYFISFDGDNNVYGGYLNTKIDKSDDWIDRNAFVFSLIRNGEVNNKRYFMKQGKDKTFLLDSNNDQRGVLYAFGNDIGVNKVGDNQFWCTDNDTYCYYEYNNDKKPFTDITYPKRFGVQRIVVVEMN